MNRLIIILCLSVFYLFGTGKGIASNNYTSKVTVKVDPNSLGFGSVAVKHAKTTVSGFGTKSYSHTKDGGDPKYPDDYGDEKSDEYTTEGGTNRAEHCFYIYAHANEGYEFANWSASDPKGNDVIGSTSAEHQFIFDNSTDKGTLPYTVTAIFRKVGVIKRETNNNAGTIKLSPDVPLTGDETIATAVLNEVGDGNTNMMTYFSHWEIEDEEGLHQIYDNPYTFEAKPMTLKAVFDSHDEVPRVGKYYRVRNAYNRVLAVAGNFKWTPTMLNADVPTALLRWAMPLDYNEDDFNASWPVSDAFEPIYPEASPSTIFYIESGTNGEETLTGAVLTGQGLNTKDNTGQTLDVVKVFDHFYGYYGIECKVSNEKVAFKAIPREDEGIINLTSAAYSSPVCAMAIQPIDEEHIDLFWFGAKPEEHMDYDNGLWTSMYTAFPYKVYEPDGVEAYYITETKSPERNDNTYACLTKIEDGIVPANTAVLLKCHSTDSKENRLIPLAPGEVTKKIEGNLLKGEFQLYTDANKNGRKNYDASSMRLLGLDAMGSLGFVDVTKEGDMVQQYETFAVGDDNDAELAPNKIYLDLNEVSDEHRGAEAFRITTYKEYNDNFTTGIADIMVDNPGVKDSDRNIYDLFGRTITNPQRGNIYIINGKKVLWRK